MPTSIYPINKGINRSMEFKGLKAQYIMYLAIVVLSLLILFAILYAIGLNSYINLCVILAIGSVSFIKIYQLSNRYGRYGLMKKAAYRVLPKMLKVHSRKIYFKRK